MVTREERQYESRVSGAIDFSVENMFLSSADLAPSNEVDGVSNFRQLISVRRDEGAFEEPSMLTNEETPNFYVQSIHDPLNLTDFHSGLTRENDLNFLASQDTYQETVDSANGNVSVSKLDGRRLGSTGSQDLTQAQFFGYFDVNVNQIYVPQQSSSSSQASSIPSHSTLNQVLTSDNRQTTFPNFVSPFLRQRNVPGPRSSTISLTVSSSQPVESLHEVKNTIFHRSNRSSKNLDNGKVKNRGDGNKLLSSRATCVLEGWYEANTEWPYPSKAEKQVMASAGGITLDQVNSWFANRRNRSQNTRPKKNMVKLVGALSSLCEEYQQVTAGVISASEMKNRIMGLIHYHLQRKQ